MTVNLGVTEVNMNVEHDGISPETRLCCLQKGILILLISSGDIQERTKGGKRDF